eukprot:g33970.t1
MQQTHQGVLIKITYQYLLPWVNLNLFFVAPPRRALYPTFPGYTFLPSSRRAARDPNQLQSKSTSVSTLTPPSPSNTISPVGRLLESPSASEPASTPLACCTPWSGDPNDHTDGHRIIPCPWNRFHLCEVLMNRNHRIKLIPRPHRNTPPFCNTHISSSFQARSPPCEPPILPNRQVLFVGTEIRDIDIPISDKNKADILTKQLPTPLHQRHKNIMTVLLSDFMRDDEDTVPPVLSNKRIAQRLPDFTQPPRRARKKAQRAKNKTSPSAV